MKAGSSVMPEFVIQSPVQLTHFVPCLTMVRQVQQPIRAVALYRVDEEGRIEACACPSLYMAIKPVLDEVAPTCTVSHVYQRAHVLARKLDVQQRLGLGRLRRKKIDQRVD